MNRAAPRPASGQNRAVLDMGVIVLGVTDRERATAFWAAALGWDVSRPMVSVMTPEKGS